VKDKVTLQISSIFRLVKLFEKHWCKILIKVGTNQQMMRRAIKLEERGCAEICRDLCKVGALGKVPYFCTTSLRRYVHGIKLTPFFFL
jgi:hypothetical protein